MPTHTAAPQWLASMRRGLTLAHITLGWFALSAIAPIASSTVAQHERPAAALVFWCALCVVAVIAGPMLSASALATDRHSGFIAFEQQRTARSALRLAAHYALAPQRFLVTAPLATAPMMFWTQRADSHSTPALYVALTVGAQLLATVVALAIAASVRHSTSPGSSTGLSMLAILGALGASTAAVAKATTPYGGASPVYLFTCAALTLAIAAGTLRKLRDEEAPFFSPALAIGAQLVVALSLATTLSGWSTVRDPQQIAVRISIVAALTLAALTRNSESDGAQDVVRWRLDDARRPFDARDPRRTIALSAILGVSCALPLLGDSARLSLSTLATWVFGVAILLITASIAVVQRTRGSATRWLSFASIPLVLWTAFAVAAEPDSLAARTCPSLLASGDPLSVEMLALRSAFAALCVIAAIAWAQRSFARKVGELRVE
jgi:hypothetical protein